MTGSVTGSVSERLEAEVEASEITAASGNEAVTGRLAGERRVTVGLVPGYARHASRPDLERRFAEVVAGLMGGLEQSQQRRIARAGGSPVRETHSHDWRRQAYLDRLDQMVARGSSEEQLVAVTRLGWDNVTVELAPDVLDRLDDAALGEAVARATEAMMDDRRQQVLAAKREIYYHQPGEGPGRLGG